MPALRAARAYRAGTAGLCVALLAGTLVGAAQARPPAPGAPGERHTWAPADKHGFGSAIGPESPAWFTLRSAELSEIYYPDLSTPSFRDLEFAVTDGRSFLDRETDAAVRSEVEALPGALAFRQTTETARWKLTKTWVTDPRRATVLADVRFKHGRGGRSRSTCSPIPPPATTATTTAARPVTARCWRGTTPSPAPWSPSRGCGMRPAATPQRQATHAPRWTPSAGWAGATTR